MSQPHDLSMSSRASSSSHSSQQHTHNNNNNNNNNNNINSNSSSSNIHNSNQYTMLLSTMVELRGDLERTVAKLQEMESQNLNLTRNYELVKGELLDTRRKYNEVRESFNGAVKDRIESEKKYEGLINSIKSQLAERTREFEKQKEVLKPKDIDSIRIKVQEELEIPHKMKIQGLMAEAEQQKAATFEMRKAFEVEVTSLKAENLSIKEKLDFVVKKSDLLQASLREQIAELQVKLLAQESDDKTRALSIKVHEL